jgi:HK97 family phage major capsid protein
MAPINLKLFYDDVMKAEAKVAELSQTIAEHKVRNENEKIVELRAQLDEAIKARNEANATYMTMRQATGDGNQRFTPVGDDDLALGMSGKEISDYSLMRAIRAAADARNDPNAWNKAGLELEASRAMAQKLGRDPKGFFVPWDVQMSPMRPRNTQQSGDPSTGGYLHGVEHMAQSFIDVLRNKMVLRQAGATVMTGMTGDVDIPKKTGGATAYWIGEGNSPSKSTLQFGQVAARPRTVAAYAQLTRRFIKQSSPDAETLVREDIAEVIAQAADKAGLHGAGSALEPLGVSNMSGIGSVVGDTNGASPDWDDIVGLETEVAVDNADIGRLAYITNTKVRGKLKRTPVISGQHPFVWQANQMNDYAAYATNQVRADLTKGNSSVCSAIFFGNWADLVYLFWGGLDVIVDPYTNSTSGDVLISAMQDLDIIGRRVQSFAAMLDALTA